MKTSVSDGQSYPQACERAASDPSFFQNFRRDAAYREILEHVSNEEGLQHLVLIHHHFPDLLQRLELFRQNDAVGNPFVCDYGPQVGSFSPTTLRYAKVFGELRSMFGSLDGLRIIEIGAGYGGQCRIIKGACQVASYTIVDLPSPLKLIGRYLSHFSIDDVELLTMEDLKPAQEFDLVVSNYAFSELRKDIQDYYINRIMRRCPLGYLTCNFIWDETYRKEELQSRIPNAISIMEHPLGHPNNYILAWKRD